MSDRSGRPLTYRDAGVDIAAGDALIDAIRPIAARTRRPGWLGELGGFGGLFELPVDRYREPVLVSSTDGVGTKLKLAFALEVHDTVGIDLVAMCANDVIAQGAEPMFFLDYFATGRLRTETAVAVMRGIGRGCELAGASLIGGETAEMPGMYGEGEYDLAGFCVGVVEKANILDPGRVRPGDAIIGLAASGPHSNGYSLIRKILDEGGFALDLELQGRRLGERLLEPTHIYARPVNRLMTRIAVHAIAHITGGGIPGNVRRVLPRGTRAVIDAGAWPRPVIFEWLQREGRIETMEMYRTFNCGVGMVLMVADSDAEAALAALADSGTEAWPIGRIEGSVDEPEVTIG